MKLIPFLTKTNHPNPSSPPFQWPSCTNTRTLSFRASDEAVTFTPSAVESEPASDPVETLIKGLTSERLLFYEPGETRSIVAEAHRKSCSCCCNTIGLDAYKDSVAMPLDSNDPCGDFRRSMEEMVEAHGLKEWESFEKLLTCYLRVNAKSNHGYIITAFVDLLVTLCFAGESSSSSLSSSNSFTISPSSDLPSSPLSSLPCLSQLLDQENDQNQNSDVIS